FRLQSLEELACKVAGDGCVFDLNGRPGASQLIADKFGLLYRQLTQRTLGPFGSPQCVVTSSNSDAGEPSYERPLLSAAVATQGKIGARETLLHNVFDLLTAVEEPISQ